MKRLSSRFARGALVLAMVATAGCAMMSQSSGSEAKAQAAPTPVPYVQNCVEISVGSPSKFVCNGKTYASFQLAIIREGEAKKYASGK